jgi:hypothetical protein
MKRSKLFLAGTTCMLAIAGVAATNAHKIAPRTVYYTSTAGICTAEKFTSCSVNGGGPYCRTGITTGKALWTRSWSAGFCGSNIFNHYARYNAN